MSHSHGLPRSDYGKLIASILLYVILGVLSIFSLAIQVPKLATSWVGFVRDLPLYIQKIKQLAREWKTLVPARYGSEEIQWLIDKVSDNIDAAARKSGLMVYRFGTRIFFNIFNLVLAQILVFFMLYYKITTIQTIASWIPEPSRDIVVGIGCEVKGDFVH